MNLTGYDRVSETVIENVDLYQIPNRKKYSTERQHAPGPKYIHFTIAQAGIALGTDENWPWTIYSSGFLGFEGLTGNCWR